MSFGAFPEVSLEQARRKRDEARTQKAAGKDPGEVRRQEKAERESMSKNSFGALAAKWMELAESKVSPKRYTPTRVLWKEICFRLLAISTSGI